MSTQPIQIVAATRTSNGPLLRPLRQLLWVKEGKKCHWCGIETRLCAETDADQATIEHIIPKCKGGTNDLENLASSCRQCNGRRAFEYGCGLEEGALLGKWPLTREQRKSLLRPNYYKHVSLTGDEKKAIMTAKPKVNLTEMYRSDRDRLLTEVIRLRDKNKELEAAQESLSALLKLAYDKAIQQECEMDSVSLFSIAKRRIAKRLLTFLA